MSTLNTLQQIQILDFPTVSQASGVLAVFQANTDVPFDIARVFVVNCDTNTERGRHAHRQCSQLLVCLRGAIEVGCDDGKAVKAYPLETPNQGLLIPPGIWATQTYTKTPATLMVLCDHPYSEADYIRHYAAFQTYREHALI